MVIGDYYNTLAKGKSRSAGRSSYRSWSSTLSSSRDMAPLEGRDNEITMLNYEERILHVIDLIEMCDFVAIDATVETTGFLLKNEEFNPAFVPDTDNCFGRWYDVIREHEKSACLLEIGIALFKRNPENPKELECEAFQIPLLPGCIDDNEIARFRGNTWARLNFNGYGRDFLKGVDFDLTIPFYMGAPYLNRHLQERADEYMKDNPNFMVTKRKRRLNSCLMPELYKEVSEKERGIIIERLTGVSKLFKAISHFRKPLVGHNLLLKIIFMYKDFVEYLPETFPDCWSNICSMFSLIYDTKQLASDLGAHPNIPEPFRRSLKSTKMYELLRNMNLGCDLQRFTVISSQKLEDYVEDAIDICNGHRLEQESSSNCYVSGFDAFLSGLVYLDLINIIELCRVDCGKRVCNGTDYLEVFLKGYPVNLKNKMFGQPLVNIEDHHLRECCNISP